MKKGILIIFTLCFVLSIVGCSRNSINEEYNFNKEKINPSVAEANTAFAFQLFNELNKEDENDNVFISPFSVSTALTMTYQGAETSTREDMAKALRYEGIEDSILNESYQNLLGYLNRIDKKIHLDINNSIWIREGEEIKEDFIQVNKDIFRADVTELDFSKEDSVDKINQWIDDSTKGKIKKMIDGPISSDVIMYLINAIYFKGEWSEQFKKENTFETEFYAENGETQKVMMMSKHGDVEYGEGDDFKAVKLPYGNEKTAMYIMLPKKEESIISFMNNMDLQKWNTIKDSISTKEDVSFQMPRFTIEYGIKNLNQSLSNLGMEKAFTDSADFSGIRNEIFINRVLHKAVIEVNEEGSEAAGVTVVEMTESSAVEPLTFVANRPFAFIIADEEFGDILFMGKMVTAE